MQSIKEYKKQNKKSKYSFKNLFLKNILLCYYVKIINVYKYIIL